MKLYNLRAGVNPRRVRIFLAEKAIAVPMVEVDMEKGENRTPAFLAKNPLGGLPVLELDDGSMLTESVAICRYFEEVQPAPPLFGTDPLDRARVEMWNRRMELEIQRPLTDAFIHTHPFWHGRRQQVAEYGRLARDDALQRMAWLDDELAGRAFVAGERYTVADITAQCALLLGKNTGTPIPHGMPHLARWFASVTARPSARA
jgi:glutathione S-transferase